MDTVAMPIKRAFIFLVSSIFISQYLLRFNEENTTQLALRELVMNSMSDIVGQAHVV